MTIDDAGNIPRPGDFGGVKGVCAEPACQTQAKTQADGPNDDSLAHNAPILPEEFGYALKGRFMTHSTKDLSLPLRIGYSV